MTTEIEETETEYDEGDITLVVQVNCDSYTNGVHPIEVYVNGLKAQSQTKCNFTNELVIYDIYPRRLYVWGIV